MEKIIITLIITIILYFKIKNYYQNKQKTFSPQEKDQGAKIELKCQTNTQKNQQLSEKKTPIQEKQVIQKSELDLLASQEYQNFINYESMARKSDDLIRQLKEDKQNLETLCKNKQNQIMDLKATAKDVEALNEKIEVLQEKLNSKNSKQVQENKKLQLANEESEKKIENLKKQNEITQNKAQEDQKNLQKELNSSKVECINYSQQLKNQIKLLKQRDDEVLHLNESLKQCQKDNNNLKEENRNLQHNLNNQNERLKEFMQKKEELKMEVPQKDESQYGYDIIIKMKSIKDLENSSIDNFKSDQKQKRGLQIQQFKEDLNLSFQNVIVVGMQGQRNKGKTFILNSLIDQNFPSDYHVSTPGICLKYHSIEGKNVVYVDSEGLNCPISINYEENIHYKKFMDFKMNNNLNCAGQHELNLQQDITDKHMDLKATEQIQQEFILQSSNILIIVVSYLTIDDQKLIHSLSQRFVNDKKYRQNKHLYVIHNLKDYTNPNYVKDYFENLKKIFPVRQMPYTQIKKVHQDDNNLILCDNIQPHINHIIMGQQGSEAGRVYNRFALEYLRHAIGINQGENDLKVQNQLCKYLNQHLKSYVTLKSETDEANQTPIQEDFIEYDKDNQSLCLKQGWQIEKIKELQVNIFGSVEKDCSYSLVDVKGSKLERHLIVEITGTATHKTKFEKKTGQFTIQINQNNQIETDIGEIYASTRKFDERYHIIQICDQNENWIYERNRNYTGINGIYKYYFTKETEEELQ